MNKSSPENVAPVVARVYDIVDCGPGNRFVANGKLIHNSGGDKMNLQNLPRGGTLRRALTAPPGKLLLACDSAQIEARMVAWLAGQDSLLHSFREGRDVYCEFASDVYGRKITKADKLERHVGKTAVLGLGYGMGYAKFQATLALGSGGVKVDLMPEEAQTIVGTYRTKYPRICALWDRCGWALGQMVAGNEGSIKDDLVTFGHEHIRLPNGLRLHYPLLKRGADGFKFIGDSRAMIGATKAKILGEEYDGWTYVYGGKITENIVQALARIVVCDQMVRIGQRYKVVLQVHDEVVCLVDEAEAEEAKAFVEDVMRTPPVWAPDLPVKCEANLGANYAEAK